MFPHGLDRDKKSIIQAWMSQIVQGFQVQSQDLMPTPCKSGCEATIQTHQRLRM